MDYASVLRVMVQIEGLTKAAAQLGGLDAMQRQVSGSSTNMGRDLDTTTAKASGMASQVAKASQQARGLSDGLDRNGRSATAAAASLDRAAGGAANLHSDLDRARQASTQASSVLGVLGNDTDDYASALLRSHGMSTQAVESTRALQTARQTLAGHVGGLLGDEDDLATAMQRSHVIHQDASRATEDLATKSRGLGSVIKSLGGHFDGFGESKKRVDTLVEKNVGTFGGFSTVLSSFGGVLATLPSGFSVLGLAGYATAAALVAMVGVIVALGSALGPLVGLAGAAAVAVSAAGQGFGVFKLASMGISAALREQTTNTAATGAAAGQAASQQRSAARAIQSAMDGVRTAHEQVRSAVQALRGAEDQEKTALVGVTQARTDARRALTDMASGLETARQSETSATLALGDAKTALSQLVNGPGTQRVAEAAQQVTDAIHGQQAAVLALTAAHQAYDDLAAGPGPQKLLEATQQVTNALHSQQAAQLALTDAKAAYDALIAGPSTEDSGKAQLSVAQAQHAQKQSAIDLAAAQKKADQILGSSSATDAQKQQAALDLANAQDQVASANFRVTDAQAALDKLNAGPTDTDKAKALLAVQQATDSVADSTNSATDAQTALDRLKAGPSAQDLASALLAVQQAQDQVADSTNSTIDAQAALDKLKAPASAVGLAKAVLAVDEAQQQLSTTTRDRERQEKDLAAAQRAGVAGSAQVLAATRAVKDAQQQEANARRQLRDAIIAVSRAEGQVHDAQLNAADSATRTAAASSRLNTAMNGLPPAAQAFVRQLISLKPRLDELRSTAAAGLFPGVSAGLTAVMRNFEPVKRVVGETATALGDLTHRAGDMVGSAAWGRDIQTVGRRNADIISTVGDGALHVADALRHVIVAAGPLTSWLARTADGWASNVGSAARAGRENGRLAGFFDRTRHVLELIGDITGHVARGLLGVGHAGVSSGNDMLGAIDRAARRFDTWTHSVDGQRSLKDFFHDSTELLRNLIPVLQGVGRATASIGFGPMNTALKLAGPYAEQATYAFLAFKAAMTIAAIIAAVTGAVIALTGAYSALAAGVAFSTVVQQHGVIATFAVRGAMLAAAAASRVWAAAQWLLNAALDANPIGLIIIGVAALVAGIVLLIRHWDQVKAALNSVLEWVQDHWVLLGTLLFGPFGFAVTEILTHWGQVTSFFRDLPGRIIGFIHGAGDGLLSVGTWMLDKVVDGFKTLTNALASVGGWLKNRAVETIHAEADNLTGLGTWVLDTIVGGFRIVTGLLTGVGGWLYRQVMGVVHDTANDLGALGGWVLATLVNGITYVSDKGISGVSSVGNWILKQLTTLLHSIKDDFGGLGGNIIGWIIGGLEQGAYDLQSFLNRIIRVINNLPGVNIPKIDVLSKDSHGDVHGFAQGGAFSQITGSAIAPGGVVSSPLIMLGEEAPTHPEYVVPTNPAYRSRALALHQQAGRALGLAQGGVFSEGEIEGVWNSAGGASSKAHTMGLIAEAESSGKQFAYNRSGASGLWQILGQVVAGNIFDPIVNAKNAIAKSSNGVNLHPWDASRSVWGPQVSSGGGVLGAIGGAVSGAIGAARDAASFISGLPGVGDLPDWLQGTGRYVLDHVGSWIRGQLGGILNGGDRATGPAGGGGLGTFDGLPVANWIIPELEWARKHGWTGHITSGYRDPSQVVTNAQGLVAPQGRSNHNLTAYPGGAIDVGDPGARAAGQALYESLLNYPGARRLVWGGPAIGDWGHFSATGHAIGGILGATSGAWAGLPFGGSFDLGGLVPGAVGQPVAIVAHGGERVVKSAEAGTQSGSSAPVVNFNGPVTFHDERDAVVLAREVGWEVAR